MFHQVQIQDLVKRGGGQLLRSKVADIVERSCVSEVKLSMARIQGLPKGPGSFWGLMLKYAFSHTL